MKKEPSNIIYTNMISEMSLEELAVLNDRMSFILNLINQELQERSRELEMIKDELEGGQ